MNQRHCTFLNTAAAAVLLICSAATPLAHAAANYDFTAAILTESNNCLIPGSDRGIYVMKCKDGGARYSIVDGRVRTADGLCFDHGVVKGANPDNNGRHIKLVPCHNGKSQVWYFMTSGKNVNLAQNAANTDVCMNIEGGKDKPRTRLLVWNCGFGNPGAGERFYLGGKMNASQMRQLPQTTINALANGGSAVYSNGVRLVAAGGGNLVAAGGGNLVAAGGGNLVAAGGGNLVAAGGGNLVAAGGGNLVAAGGGNLVASLIGNDGSTLRSLGTVSFKP